MKLIIAIVNSDDSEALLDNLSQRGLRVTIVSTIGGFLRRGNTTLFIGADDDQLEQVFYIIRKNCRTRSSISILPGPIFTYFRLSPKWKSAAPLSLSSTWSVTSASKSVLSGWC